LRAKEKRMQIEEAERILSASADYKVLRRIPASPKWSLAAEHGEIRRALYIDVESTGLSQETDEVIELAIVPFDYDPRSGAIVRVDEAGSFCSFRQPSFPIPPESTKIHGIKDADVAGSSINEAAVSALVSSAHLIVAHNSSFDRPMVEKHWPCFAEISWACSFNDVNWRGEGLSTGKLDYLLLKQGWFYDGHRALQDAMAGVFLLSYELPVSKRPALAELLESARRPLKAVRAEGSPFEKSDLLRKRNYKWDPGDGAKRLKSWWILVEDAQAECAWLDEYIYEKVKKVPIFDVPATKRYSARIWSA
jgi:DNA polymerase III subunit epsilon